MNKELSDYIDNFAKQHNEVFYYMNMLGYRDIEIKTAIAYFNVHHAVDIYSYKLPLIIGKLVQIIERNYYETY